MQRRLAERLRAVLRLGHALRKGGNPHGETRGYLARGIARWGFEIGAYSYGRPKVRFAETGAPLRIGRYCSFADKVEIMLGGNHRLDWVSTFPFAEKHALFPDARAPDSGHATRGGVTIGHDVWLGSGCLILSGVTIGHGAAIGAHAVVTRDVPPYAVVAGNPARILRHRFDSAQVADLLEAAWWDLPHAAVTRIVPLLSSGRVGDLVAAARAERAASGISAPPSPGGTRS